MLNTTKLAKYIGSKLGISHAHLEMEMAYLLEIIKDHTLVTFSKYYPYQLELELKIGTNALTVPGSAGDFIIPTTAVNPAKILSLRRLVMSHDNSEFYPGLAFDGAVVNRQLRNNITSGMTTPITSEFIRPNILRIYPRKTYVGNIMQVTFHTIHPDTFYTIPTNMEDEFKELALVDVKDAIYNIRKQYENITTAFGSLELNLSQFEGMAEKRRDIVEYWKKNYWKSAHRKRIFHTNN